MPIKNLQGQDFGKLHVIMLSTSRSSWGAPRWVCRCSCENKTIVLATTNHLTQGTVKSCGCLVERSKPKSCLICDKEFMVKPCQYELRKTCSYECSAKHRAEYMQGEGNHQFGLLGELNASFQGGRRLSNYGYVLVHNPERSRGSDNYVFEHRLVMEEHLGRHLSRDEVVHHKNHDKTDNRIENLEIMSLAEHTRLHAIAR